MVGSFDDSSACLGKSAFPFCYLFKGLVRTPVNLACEVAAIPKPGGLGQG